MHSTSDIPADRGSLKSFIGDIEFDAGVEGILESDVTARPKVIFSIPSLKPFDDELCSVQDRELAALTADISAPSASAAIVPLSVPEANVLQTLVQGSKQRFIDLASGSVFWRLFVGSGVALFIGAVTLILLGPNPEQLKSDETAKTISNLRTVDQGPVALKSSPIAAKANSSVELTVSTGENGDRAEPAEYVDPFTEANQVPAKVTQAVHFDDPMSRGQRSAIQTVSRETNGRQPAWLSGTIDLEDDEDAVQSKR